MTAGSQTISLAEVATLTRDVLGKAGLSHDHVEAIVRIIVDAERDECHSHGVYRLVGCVRTIKAGKLVVDAEPKVDFPAPSVVRVDAGGGYAPLAFQRGLQPFIDVTRKQGIAAMAINRCFHFHALWAEIEPLTEAGLVALAMTPSHSWVTPAGGSKPLFGTNPIAFGWPRPGQNPFVFDFATSAVARGEIELHARAGKPIPLGWGVDEDGEPTTDASAALRGAMLTFGGHKGSALSAMVELMAGPLIGDLMSTDSMAFDDGDKGAPYHGELIIAIDPAAFLGGAVAAQLDRAEAFFQQFADQGARLPSQRRYTARARTPTEGVVVPQALMDELNALR